MNLLLPLLLTSGVISNEVDVTDNKSRGIESGDETTYSSVTISDGHYHDFVLDKLKVGDGFAIFPGPGKRDTTGMVNQHRKYLI